MALVTGLTRTTTRPPKFLGQVSYMVAMPFQVAADVPGAVAFDPVEPVIVLLYLLGAALLVRRSRTDATRMEEGSR